MTTSEKILVALQAGPKTGKELSEISLDYGRRIRELRESNHDIQHKNDRYTLKG